MNAQSLNERKEFWVWAYASESFKRAIAAYDFMIKPRASTTDDVNYVLALGVVVTYARPFLNCCGVEPLPQRMVPMEYEKHHKSLLDLRHKAMAHMDAVGFQADDAEFGNINQVRFTVTESGHTTSVLEIS